MPTITSNQLNAGMVITLNNKLYRVESVTKVAPSKGVTLIKASLRDINTQTISEKSFKLNQSIEELAIEERAIEFLYIQDSEFLFLDIVSLDLISVPSKIIGNKVNFLKEGTEIKAAFYGDTIFSVEFPPVLEIMVAKVKSEGTGDGSKVAILETGAKIEVPLFIEVGDIIKVDPIAEEYIQRM
jgi:elongation factor P